MARQADVSTHTVLSVPETDRRQALGHAALLTLGSPQELCFADYFPPPVGAKSGAVRGHPIEQVGR